MLINCSSAAFQSLEMCCKMCALEQLSVEIGCDTFSKNCET